ncbi:MAG: FecR family protein [Bacteroidota bacterium]
MEKLLLKYLQGNLSLEEQHELSKWKEKDTKNSVILRKLEIYWNDYRGQLNHEDLEVRKRILSRIEDEKHIRSGQRVSFTKYLLRIAAVLILGLSVALIALNNQTQVETKPAITWAEKVSGAGQKVTTILPDGTSVKLNSNSKIIAPSFFGDDVRKVILHGEAFFEVTRDESKPFIIETDNMEITVLGTSFMVSAYQYEKVNSVLVKSGKVEVKEADSGHLVQLNKNEYTQYQGEGEMKKLTIKKPEYVFGWVDGKLQFNDQTEDEVLKSISKWYGVEITMNRKLSVDKRYTASYDNPTLKEVMDILAFVYDFNYEKKGNELIIK